MNKSNKILLGVNIVVAVLNLWFISKINKNNERREMKSEVTKRYELKVES